MHQYPFLAIGAADPMECNDDQIAINSQLSHHSEWRSDGPSCLFQLPSIHTPTHDPQGDYGLYQSLVDTLGELTTEQARVKMGNTVLVSQLGIVEQNLYTKLL